MNEQQYRDVLLAKAIETPASPAAGLLSQHDVRMATEKALHELRGKKSNHQRQFERLVARRADLLLQLSGQREARLLAIRKPAQRWSVWLWALPLLALALGFASEKISEPHRLSLIALPLLAILGWNVLMYVVLLVRSMMAITSSKRPHNTEDASGLNTTASVGLWWSRSSAKFKDPALSAIYQAFLQDWSPYLQRKQSRQLQALLHVCAAMLALGVIGALWVTGMFTEYRVGWESTWLNAGQMQSLVNFLTWPAQKILGMPPWSEAQMQLLQTWPAGNQQGGQQWILAYSLLLGLVVVVPRMLLALFNGLLILRLQRSLHLPLANPYFQKLMRDFSSDTTTVLVHPFSMAMNAQRQQVLQSYLQEHFGSAAHLQFAPNLEYGETSGHSGYFRNTLQDNPPSLQVLLFNLAATPEEETQGTVMAQFEATTQGPTGVWVYCAEFAERLGTSAAAQQRLQERKQLWQQCAQGHGMHVAFIDKASTAQSQSTTSEPMALNPIKQQ